MNKPNPIGGIAHGERHYNHKLTDAQVADIIARCEMRNELLELARQHTSLKMAREYGVHRNTIDALFNGRRRRNPTDVYVEPARQFGNQNWRGRL
jgi:cell division FtsZ-interacting protein ZapD